MTMTDTTESPANIRAWFADGLLTKEEAVDWLTQIHSERLTEILRAPETSPPTS